MTFHSKGTRAFSVLALLAVTSGAANAGDNWSFEVFLDDKPIGYHDFELVGSEGRYTLTTRASFDVKILFINAFRYRHENVETWRDGCLTGISALTDNNGEALRVEGEVEADRFVVMSGEGNEILPSCIQSFAYWNPDILTADSLLNSQTGEFEDVDIVFEEREILAIDGANIAADRYALTTNEKTIRLWYSADGQRWLALEAPAKGSRKIRYEPLDVPPLPASTRLAQAD